MATAAKLSGAVQVSNHRTAMVESDSVPLLSGIRSYLSACILWCFNVDLYILHVVGLHYASFSDLPGFIFNKFGKYSFILSESQIVIDVRLQIIYHDY
jgi:hypothetical protein